MDVQEFDPCGFAAKDDEVHTLCTAKRLRAPGKAIDEELHHYFRFENGKIAFYRSTEDTRPGRGRARPFSIPGRIGTRYPRLTGMGQLVRMRRSALSMQTLGGSNSRPSFPQ
jgi:hypothetical protein